MTVPELEVDWRDADQTWEIEMTPICATPTDSGSAVGVLMDATTRTKKKK